MPRQLKTLTILKIRAIKAPGRYSDGGGLYLYVSPSGNRSWVFRYRNRQTGKHRDKGLGPLADVSLERARERAAACRASLLNGIDPLDADREASHVSAVEAAKRVTLGECVTRYIAAHRPSWRNAKHGDQWRNTLDTYASALLPLPIQALDTHLILDVLQPIWSEKTETATRVRQRLEAVLDYAIARGYRTGENPARWRGHLQKLLPPPAKLKDVRHHPALPYAELGDFMALLADAEAMSARVLALQILTATRPGEAVAARWEEFDLENRVWTIPKERMKAGREHRVPYGPAVAKLLKSLPKTGSPFLFPGKPGQPMITDAALSMLRRLRKGLTAHGFRSTFRDWAADRTNYPREVAEAALAHSLRDQTEAAYRRSDLMEKRARMMADWERFALRPSEAPASAVTNLNTKRSKEAARG